MIVTLLGTGTSSGVPLIGCGCAVCRSVDFRDKRLRTSAHVQVGNTSIVIDTGPDFRQQVLRLGLLNLDAVLFTHEHKDHTAGLDEVRAYNFRSGKDMPVYARPTVLAQLAREFSYIFAEVKYPGIPRIITHVIDNEPFDVAGIQIIPIEVMHHKLPVYGFRIGDFTYLTDLNSISDAELEKVYGTRILILDALRHEEHLSHFALNESLALIERIQPERAYLTHISHQMGLHREVNLTLPPSVRLGYDGLQIEL
ncbi:MBL fold metallo-hydrolase [Fibrella aquatilis]|uniref:MBL fold metallo-hydrolase n=1 Tax=Fibrella aquatilis TaxID=2817059 RepID=A0A939G419_9BACT|nr:MBL fold metallo-hydrolase [Fibrella aquatilis]MBO0930045.1 MBL fold metallo-hydrolase [Fibrella aquatilis]